MILCMWSKRERKKEEEEEEEEGSVSEEFHWVLEGFQDFRPPSRRFFLPREPFS